MNVLIVHAHENPDSFCSALQNRTKIFFEELGHSVVVSDLYQQQFNPTGGVHDFTSSSGAEFYKYSSEQLYASKHHGFTEDLQIEMDKLVQADILNFNFPLWWFGFPAIMKGWVDRVMAYGVAYGGEYGFHEQGRFKGKRAFITMTTGSPESAYQASGSNKRSMDLILQNIHDGIFGLVGYEVIDPFIGYGVSRIDDAARQEILTQYDSYMEGFKKIE